MIKCKVKKELFVKVCDYTKNHKYIRNLKCFQLLLGKKYFFEANHKVGNQSIVTIFI